MDMHTCPVGCCSQAARTAGCADWVLWGQDPAIFTGSDVRIRDPDLPLLHFAVAFRGAAWTDPDSIALMVMQTMIGAWDKNAGSGAPRLYRQKGQDEVQHCAHGHADHDRRLGQERRLGRAPPI